MDYVLLDMTVENAKVTEVHCICKQPDDGRYQMSGIYIKFCKDVLV